MIKKCIKSKNIFKGAVFGIAVVMCGSFVPVAALHTLADELSAKSVVTDIENQTNRIEINANNIDLTVKKGQDITIPVGVYFGKNATSQTIGMPIGEDSTITEAKVVAYYKADGAIVYDSSDSEKYSGNKFNADRIGTYVVEYIVFDNGVKYSQKVEFKCDVNDVEINFDTNSKNIIPSIYDLSLMQEKKDIVLPIPTVEDEDGIAIENLKVYLEGEEVSESEYLKISLDNAFSSSLKIEKDLATGDFYIKGEELVNANGYEFKILYKYYQNGVQVKTAEKSFKVYNEYYKQSDKSAGYNLTANVSSTTITAKVGIATSLPTITASTASTDSPSSESVEFNYEIKVNKRVNGVWQPIEGAIDKNNNFVAPSDGDYQIVFVVKDFYDHTKEVKIEALNIKDNIQATPYIYDGADENAYDAETNTYKSAETLLKSQSLARNIVLYAIGGTDNAVDREEISLTREIRTSSNNTVIYSISDYNEYNLILQPEKDGEKGLYKSIYDDNYQIRRQMILNGFTDSDEETIKTWLKNNNYLIVVNDRVTSPTGENFIEGGAEATDEELKEEGFVYIQPNSTNYKFTEQTYNIYYKADDNVVDSVANMIQLNLEVKSSIDDAVVPSILYSTELQTSYLADDTITLKAPTASDNSGDAKVEIHTAYRYLDSSKLPITTNNGDNYGSEISYLINDASKVGISSNKWYIQEGENRIVKSSGWTLLEGQDEYTIKLKNKPDAAAYIEFFSYAIDDNGNVGFYNKQIYVSTISDTKAPSLFEVITPEIDGGYVNNDTIILPTLKYKDNLPQYMNAGVVVYKVDEEDPNVQTVVHASNMSTYYESIAGNFVVEAGKFTATTGGEYLVAVTVNDIGNHSITTYFTYNVQSVPVVQDPEITNIGSKNTEIVLEDPQNLPTPKLSVTNDEGIGFIGLSDDTTETLSDYYTVSVVSASDSDGYDLSQNSFTATVKGTYKLQYNVFLVSYSTDSEYFVGETTKELADQGKLFLTINEETERTILAYKAKGGETLVGESAGNAVADEVYYIFMDKNESGLYEMRINTETTGQGKELDPSQLPAYNNGDSTVKLHSIPSSIITYTAGSVAVNLNMDEGAYEKTKYETLTEQITILPINADVKGDGEIDKDKSTVSISVSTGSTTRTIASISINEWNSVTTNSDIINDNGTLKLALNTDGKYTIKYTVKAKDKYGASVGSEKTISYEISVGDVIAPEITIDNKDNQFIKSKYEIGDKIDFKLEYIDVSDNKTDSETLEKNLVIQIKNATLSKTYPTLGASESFEITEDGEYTVSIYVKDTAGNSSVAREFTFSVGGDKTSPVNVTEVVGKVLIAISAVILGGVIVYFIVSKSKESKKKK